jgi:hypothetical protein
MAGHLCFGQRWVAIFGAEFVFAVNAITLRLAGCILDLDDFIADTLGEPRVRRIGK